MTIATRLDKAMQDAKITSQSELSRRSGIPQPTINRILKGPGKKGPETATLLALANALGVEMRWLQEGRGPQFAREETRDTDRQVPQVAVADLPQPRFLRHWLTDDEAELVAIYRSMTPSGQRLTRLFVNRQKRDSRDAAMDET